MIFDAGDFYAYMLADVLTVHWVYGEGVLVEKPPWQYWSVTIPWEMPSREWV